MENEQQKELIQKQSQEITDLKEQMAMLITQMSQLMKGKAVAESSAQKGEPMLQLYDNAAMNFSGSAPVVGPARDGGFPSLDCQQKTYVMPVEAKGEQGRGLTMEQYKKMEKWMNSMEGFGPVGALSPYKLCLVKDLIIPPDFKLPAFTLFDGTGIPLDHLTMYCRRMQPYVHDEKILIHFFQESLTGSATRWFTSLDPSTVETWEDLANLFLKKYEHNMEKVPTLYDLQGTVMKEGESFRDWAHRWRDLASQMHPPLAEQDLVNAFIDALREPYTSKIAGGGHAGLGEMIRAGERIERCMQRGNISISVPMLEKPEYQKGGKMKKKENEVHTVNYSSNPTYGSPTSDYRPRSNAPRLSSPYNHYPNSNSYLPPQYSYRPPQQTYQPPQQTYQSPQQAYRPPHQNYQPPQQAYQPPRQNYRNFENNPKPQRQIEQFASIPMTYAQCYDKLLSNAAIAPIPGGKPHNPPYPPWYNPEVTCAYHGESPGHSIENCLAFKRIVQNMVNSGWLNFDGIRKPDVTTNPLPDHGNGGTNAVEDSDDFRRKIAEVTMSLSLVLGALENEGLIKREELDLTLRYDGYDELKTCEFHKGVEGHSLENCFQFQAKVQDLIDSKKVVFGVKSGCLNAVNVIGDEFYKGPRPGGRTKPIVLQYFLEDQPFVKSPHPSKPSYVNDKAVPWVYEKNDLEVAVDNISGVSRITRTGRVYSREESSDPVIGAEAERKRKGKDVVGAEENLKDLKKDHIVCEEIKKAVTDVEIQEFLKIIRQSEYMIVDQLKKTPAKICILELIMSSEPHRKVLLRMLNQAYVSEKIPTESFDGIVGNVLATHLLSFTEEEIPDEGMGHNKALHISAMCRGFEVASILIDNGSSLNILPKETFDRLPIDRSYLKQVLVVAKAFDGTKKEIMGEIEVPLEIANVTFNVPFMVMDISPTYSCLLGRPWIHTAGAVPSSLHQNLKFAHGGRVYIVKGQSEWMVASVSNSLHIDAPLQGIESSFQSFEIATASFVKEEQLLMQPRLSKVAKFIGRIMLKMGFRPGGGLGKEEQGIKKPIAVLKQAERWGLGYKPSRIDKVQAQAEKQARRIARFEGRELNILKRSIPWLYDSFMFGDFLEKVNPLSAEAIPGKLTLDFPSIKLKGV
ncbi:uncharacterized protein LOC119981029 isoform X2 [Tripterygium wilfordii]|nr:uncharacterized protein LOC119981029 isoform X2 [Tripterygium wilfordii]